MSIDGRIRLAAIMLDGEKLTILGSDDVSEQVGRYDRDADLAKTRRPMASSRVPAKCHSSKRWQPVIGPSHFQMIQR